MGHDHHHCGHNHGLASFHAYKRATIIGGIAFVLQSLLVFISGSLTLRGDTIHLASDSLFMATNTVILWKAAGLSHHRGHQLRTMAAVVGVILLAFGAWNVFMEAREHIAQGIVVETGWMLVGGVLGLIANAMMYRALHTPEPQTLTILERGSWDLIYKPQPKPKQHVHDQVVSFHVLSDLAGSVVVVISAVISLVSGFNKMDSYSGIALAAFMTYLCITSSWNIARGESVH